MPSHHGYALDPGLKVLLAAAGVAHEDVLRRAGLPEDFLNRASPRVPSERFFALVRAVEESVDDPQLAIHLASSATAESFSPSFKDVTRATRESLSRYYLEHTRLSSTEIAYLLGFEEPNSFFRAFHSWTGTSPESVRKSVRPTATPS
ncbi:MAG: helix-turn-helix domain-containing protein [Sandaracinaceae bacterium]